MPELFAGILVSLLFTELTGYSPGGVVAAGYLAMFTAYPVWLGGTLLAAIVTWLIVRFIESHTLLYGRRLFAFYLVTGMAVSQGAMMLAHGHQDWDFGVVVIGYLIPGLIARDCGRQGFLPTLLAVFLMVGLTSLVVLAGEGALW